MGFLKEFKNFISKGNVIELAVAVIIGGAFGSIVSSLVDDIVTPLILTPALKAAHVSEINKLSWGNIKYGSFLSAVLKFLIVAFTLFSIMKAFRLLNKKKEEETKTEPSSTDKLLIEIRDILNK
jgi:large conductance mechanosensitive channel